MKRVYQLIAAVVVTLLVPVATGAQTFAASTCAIGFTGPDSQNMCTSVQTYACTVNNDNTVTITDSNNQTAASGAVSGGGTSGSVSNSSGTTFTVSITNRTCTATVIVPATTDTPPVSVTPIAAPAVAGASVKALPVTGSDQTLPTIGLVAGVAALIAALSVAATIAYRRLNAS